MKVRTHAKLNENIEFKVQGGLNIQRGTDQQLMIRNKEL